MFNWLKNLFSKSDSDSVEQESHNYFYLSYSTNLCGIEESAILKTTKSLEEVERNWFEYAEEDLLDYISHEDEEDFEVYPRVEDISKEEYMKLKKDYVEDWVY